VSAAIESWVNRGWLVLPGPTDIAPELAKHIADRLATESLRPPAQVIESAEELDALPVSSVIRTMPENVRGPHTWVCGGRGYWANGVSTYVSKTIMRNYGPSVTVLYVPTENGDTE